jgi:uncharacterized membrane protein
LISIPFFSYSIGTLILNAKSKDLADLVNKPKALNMALYALFAIGIVSTRFIPETVLL